MIGHQNQLTHKTKIQRSARGAGKGSIMMTDVVTDLVPQEKRSELVIKSRVALSIVLLSLSDKDGFPYRSSLVKLSSIGVTMLFDASIVSTMLIRVALGLT